MSDETIERYRLPSEIDDDYPAMRERLVQLQPSLEALMGKAVELFDGVYAQAPHPSIDTSVAYATATMNRCPVEGIPMGRELTVALGAEKWVRVFRNTDTCPDAFPRERLWFVQPVEEASMKINVLRTHSPTRTDYPYDIEVIDYSEAGLCLGFVGGADYHNKEPFILDASNALDEAKKSAQEHGLFVA